MQSLFLQSIPRSSSWVRSTSDFTPDRKAPQAKGNIASTHLFRENASGRLWIGKCSPMALFDETTLEAAQLSTDFISQYADEILEKLAIVIYKTFGIIVPETTLSYQQATPEARSLYGCNSPRLHYLARVIDGFESLPPLFVQNYLSQQNLAEDGHTTITTSDGETLPLHGLGRMLAVADFIFDRNCIGNECDAIGYVIKSDQFGQRYAKVVKKDAGYSFSYSKIRYDQDRDPRRRNIQFASHDHIGIQFAQLAPADQHEFIITAKQILETPRNDFQILFSQTASFREGIPSRHWQALLDGLIARKSLFLAAFAPEIDLEISNEIYSASATISEGLVGRSASIPDVESYITQERLSIEPLIRSRIQLAVIGSQYETIQSGPGCHTFQLPPPNPRFTGRSNALSQITRKLSSERGSSPFTCLLISGLAGIGKTQIALHYAHTAASHGTIADKKISYNHVVWIDAEFAIEEQLQGFAKTLIKGDVDSTVPIETVYELLRDQSALFIFDNIKDIQSIKSYLPSPNQSPNIHVLVTSRYALPRSQKEGEIGMVKLHEFTPSETREYLNHHFGKVDEEQALKICKALKGLPLAINQAVAYIKAGHCGLSDFVQHYHLNQSNLLTHRALPEELHARTLTATFTLVTAQAKIQSQQAESILGILSYLSPTATSLQMLADIMQHDIDSIKKDVEILESYSLIKIDCTPQGALTNTGHQLIKIHRLLQEVICYQHQSYKDSDIYFQKVINYLYKAIIFDQQDLNATAASEYTIKHVTNLWRISNKLKLTAEQQLSIADLLIRSGFQQYILGHYELSQTCYERALEIQEQVTGKDHPEIARTLVNLANTIGRLGNHTRKMELLLRALRIQREFYRREHPFIAKTLANLGNAAGDAGDLEAKRDYLEGALKILDRDHESNSLEIAAILTNLSAALASLGHFTEAQNHLHRSLSIQTKQLGSDHPQLAINYFNLAKIYAELGDYTQAVPNARKACTLFNERFGPKHVNTIQANNLLSTCEYKLTKL